MSAPRGPKVPGHLKRCVRCGETKPRTEAHWYFYPSSTNGRAYAHSRCKACGPAYFQEMRERQLAADPERVRAKERAYRERRGADPERRATRVIYNREWQRQHRSRGGTLRADLPGAVPSRSVDAEPIREAIERSGMDLNVVSLAAGYDASTVAKALKRGSMTLWMATRVLDAIDVLPAEVGL